MAGEYALRAGVEGTVHQAVAATGIRHTRYRGLAKTHFDHAYSATALNLIRLDAYWNDEPWTGPALATSLASNSLRRRDHEPPHQNRHPL